MIVALDAYRAITDNGVGIAEMVGQRPNIRYTGRAADC